MTTEFFSEDEQSAGGEGGQSDGGKLRAQLEAALKSNKELQGKLSTYEVREFLGGKKLDLVKAEELAGVEPTKWEETATRIQTERTELQQTLLRQGLAQKGFSEEDIESIVSGVVTSPTEVEEAKATDRVRQVGGLAATPPLPVDPSKLHGLEAIRAGLK